MTDIDFQAIVDQYYEGLYRFAYSLAHNEAEASDLTQQVFFVWAKKGHQLRDKSKVKTWLFTSLYRDFLGSRRRQTKFPQKPVEDAEHELPTVESDVVKRADAQLVNDAMMEVEDPYREPLSLFYLNDHSYKEIAEILDIPVGTVMSRLSRGKEQLRSTLAAKMKAADENIVPFSPGQKKEVSGNG